MPIVLRTGGFDFVIRFNDHAPANVHVFNADGECRIVLVPAVTLDKFWGMKGSDARKAARIAMEHVELLLREWERIHGTSA